MQNKDKFKKENAQFFFEGAKITPENLHGLVESKERVSQKVFEAYINFQNEEMKEKTSKWRMPKLRYIMPVLAVAALIIAAIPTLLVLNKEEQHNNLLKSEIAYMEGVVEYSKDNITWQEASKDMVLEEGTSVRTAKDAKAIVNLDDGSSIRLNTNSQITLTSMNSNDVVIANDGGEVYARVAKLDRDFSITTDDLTFESLGTAYKTVNTEEKQGVEVYHSQVNIIGINEEGEILVEQGNRYYIYNSDATDLEGKITEIPMDEITADEFVLWNKDQDEQVEEFQSQMGVLFDLLPPALQVSTPEDGSTTTKANVTVKGTTEANATVRINGNEIANNEGAFSKEVSLNEGANSIKVVSIDPAGNKTVKNLTVTYKPETTTTTPTTTPKITLTGTKVDGGVSLSWNVTGLDVSNGFKIVKSTSANPVYPGDSYVYLSSGSTRHYTWNITDGKTYHFRVCQYLGGKCGTYSNDITVTAPTNASPVTSINVSSNGDGTVSWTLSGYSASGFKVVWSKTSSPTYPTRATDKYQYFSSPDARASNVLDAFDGSGTYYVRVCEYLGGACGVYSNQITVTL